MIDDALAKAVVEKYKPEEVLDGVVEVLVTAQRLLEPGNTEGSLDFAAGLAMQEIVHATKVVRAFRQKQYGQKGTTIL